MCASGQSRGLSEPGAATLAASRGTLAVKVAG